jgi:hypothetical protein
VWTARRAATLGACCWPSSASSDASALYICFLLRSIPPLRHVHLLRPHTSSLLCLSCSLLCKCSPLTAPAGLCPMSCLVCLRWRRERPCAAAQRRRGAPHRSRGIIDIAGAHKRGDRSRAERQACAPGDGDAGHGAKRRSRQPEAASSRRAAAAARAGT